MLLTSSNIWKIQHFFTLNASDTPLNCTTVTERYITVPSKSLYPRDLHVKSFTWVVSSHAAAS